MRKEKKSLLSAIVIGMEKKITQMNLFSFFSFHHFLLDRSNNYLNVYSIMEVFRGYAGPERFYKNCPV